MSRCIMLIPTSPNIGLTEVTLGLLHAIERQGFNAKLFKPIAQAKDDMSRRDKTPVFMKKLTSYFIEPFSLEYSEDLIRSHQESILMEKIVENYSKLSESNPELILIEGLVPTNETQSANRLNLKVAKTLDADIIFVSSLEGNSLERLQERTQLAKVSFSNEINVLGVIVNKVNSPNQAKSQTQKELSLAEIQKNSEIPILGSIPWMPDLQAHLAIDIANYLGATILHKGEIEKRRIKQIKFCSADLANSVDLLKPETLLVTSGTRDDILILAALSVMNGVQLGAILLTDNTVFNSKIESILKPALTRGLPVFNVETDFLETANHLHKMKFELSENDPMHIQTVQTFVADCFDHNWIKSLNQNQEKTRRFSPPAFRYQLTELAKKANKTIVLPEGDEPRTVKAASICAEQGIAKCILLGNPDEIKRVAISQGIELHKDLQLVDPTQIRRGYIPRLVELRKNKGMTEAIAREQLADNVVLGTMMLEQDEVDGLVSGAVHTTANTIRPALQLIKTAEGSSLVSSVFFMLMPEQVYIYGDCAINPDPTASELADIAIQSADTAIAFGIEACVAMISYSTGSSGIGADVDKVREATKIAQERRPDLVIDGPLQYDAAVMPDVAKSKAPDSKVAGKATVFIFPDLNTGNTTYKAVQRSANVVSIGPMLQGMRKPVNDLSRGALVDDIVYTIALTAIQAAQKNVHK